MASINDEEEESADETNNASEEGADANDVNEEDIINEADRKPPRLFTFTCVNSYGTAEVDAIKDDGKPIKFSNRCGTFHLCIENATYIISTSLSCGILGTRNLMIQDGSFQISFAIIVLAGLTLPSNGIRERRKCSTTKRPPNS